MLVLQYTGSLFVGCCVYIYNCCEVLLLNVVLSLCWLFQNSSDLSSLLQQSAEKFGN